MEEWTQTRWEDYVITLQWLYDYHTAANDTTTQALLVDTMQRLRQTGSNWFGVFEPANFPKLPTEQLGASPFGVLTWHGVNMAEGLKAGAAAYRLTGNASGMSSSREMWRTSAHVCIRPRGLCNWLGSRLRIPWPSVWHLLRRRISRRS